MSQQIEIIKTVHNQIETHNELFQSFRFHQSGFSVHEQHQKKTKYRSDSISKKTVKERNAQLLS